MKYAAGSTRSRALTPGWLFWLMNAVCAALLITFVHEMVAVINARDALAEVVPTGYGSRMFLRPFVLAAVVLLLWWRFWWPQREGARILALTAAFFLFVNWAVLALNNSLGQTDYPAAELWLYLFSALVFGVYAIAGREY